MEKIMNGLIEEMKKIPVIDGHQHLDVEEEMLARPVDIANRLIMYTYGGLQSTGMPTDIAEIRLAGIASTSFFLKPSKVNIKKNSPERNTIPKAVSQLTLPDNTRL